MGSSKKKHKIVEVYMTIANILAWQRCQVNHIQLICLVYEKDIKNVALKKILEHFLNDVQILEQDGVLFQINDTFIRLKGTVVAVAGDNLGSHQIRGFQENFNFSNYFCRYCNINNISNDYYENIKFISERRTTESHLIDVEIATTTNEPHRGVKSDFCLNSLNYFFIFVILACLHV